MKQRKCKHCGSEMPKGSRFCPCCGYAAGSSFKKRLLPTAVVFIVLMAGIAGTLYWIQKAPVPASVSLAETQISAGSGTLYIPDADSYATDEETGLSYVNDIVLLFFAPDTAQEQIDQAISATGGTVVGSLPAINQVQVQIEACSLPELQKLCEQLNEMDGVALASYDPVVFLEDSKTSDDPWPEAENGDNAWWETILHTKQPKEKTWWLDAIHAQEAWEYDSQFSPVRIGIIDSGFDTNHEDLKNKINFVNALNLPDSHGTRCAGIIGAEADNGLGMSGIVWNGDLDLWDLSLTKVQRARLKNADGNYSDLNLMLGGAVSLIEDGCKVINLSQGQSTYYTMHTDSKTGQTKYRLKDDGGDMTLDEWLNTYSSMGCHELIAYYFLPLLEKGYDFVLVQSADNGDSKHTSVDARLSGIFTWVTLDKEDLVVGEHYSSVDLYNRIIVVGSAGRDGNGEYIQASSSNAGPRVDICAPGEDIYSTDVNNTYTYNSGTSFAAPIVSGVAGLVWAANPDLTGEQVKSILCDGNNSTDMVADNPKKEHPLVDTYPLVNAAKCVEAALQTKTSSGNAVSQKDNVGSDPNQIWLLTEKVQYDSNMEPSLTTTYEYTPDGTLSSSTETDALLSHADSPQIYTTKSLYDANGHCIQETTYYNNETTPTSQTTRTFDEKGNLTQEYYSGEVAFGGEFIYENTYDAAGQLENVRCYNNGELYQDITYTYSGTEHTEEMYQYLIAAAHTITTYDEHGNIIKSVNYLDDGTTQETIYTYEYDDHGNKISQSWIDDQSNATPITYWNYTYDEHGNITECQESSGNSTTSTTKYTYKTLSEATGQKDATSTATPDPIPTSTDFGYLEECIRYQGRFYKIESTALPWSGAKIACESKGGHLATITTQDEQELIQTLNDKKLDLWIGGYQNADGSWCWVTDEPWSYTNWGSGKPDTADGQTCAVVAPDTWSSLADNDVYEQSGYIFEWDQGCIPEADRGDTAAYAGYYDNPDATSMNSTYSITIQENGAWNWSGNRTKMSGISYVQNGTLHLIATASSTWSNVDSSGWSDAKTSFSGTAELNGTELTITWREGFLSQDAVADERTETMTRQSTPDA